MATCASTEKERATAKNWLKKALKTPPTLSSLTNLHVLAYLQLYFQIRIIRDVWRYFLKDSRNNPTRAKRRLFEIFPELAKNTMRDRRFPSLNAISRKNEFWIDIVAGLSTRYGCIPTCIKAGAFSNSASWNLRYRYTAPDEALKVFANVSSSLGLRSFSSKAITWDSIFSLNSKCRKPPNGRGGPSPAASRRDSSFLSRNDYVTSRTAQ